MFARSVMAAAGFRSRAFSYLPGEPWINITIATSPTGRGRGRSWQSGCAFADEPVLSIVAEPCLLHLSRRSSETAGCRCIFCALPRMSCTGTLWRIRQIEREILSGCVDCHMPVQASNLIISNSNGKRTGQWCGLTGSKFMAIRKSHQAKPRQPLVRLHSIRLSMNKRCRLKPRAQHLMKSSAVR